MKHGSLFSGIGGFDLAAQWMGWENVFHCEKEPFCQKVLKFYWPDAELFEDITKSDFTKYANSIDILTGGFPCQPYSTAGKRLGKEDERHLWPQMLRAIREIRPRWIVGENVRGLTNWNGGVVFDEVQADLEAEGYETLPFLLPACAVGAPHRRDRIWIIAFNSQCKPDGRHDTSEGNGERLEVVRDIMGKAGRYESSNNIKSSNCYGHVTHTESLGFERWQQSKNAGNGEGKFGRFDRGSCVSGWEHFPTVSPVCNGNDGLSYRLDIKTISFSKWRNESIKAGGNAIVPQVVYEIFKAIERYEHNAQSRRKP